MTRVGSQRHKKIPIKDFCSFEFLLVSVEELCCMEIDQFQSKDSFQGSS